MFNSISSFFRNNVGRSQDFASSPKANAALIGGATALGAGIGAAIGAARQAEDVVTIEQVPYQETVRVQVGTQVQHGCYQYHYGYDAMNGEFGYHYGYDSSCTEVVPKYETRYTGRTLHKEVKHHSVGFPNTVVQGALLGVGVGLATGIVGSVAIRALSQ